LIRRFSTITKQAISSATEQNVLKMEADHNPLDGNEVKIEDVAVSTCSCCFYIERLSTHSNYNCQFWEDPKCFSTLLAKSCLAFS